MIPNAHADHDGFRAALEFTSRSTGFRIDLIEKDYFCSLVLAYIYTSFDGALIFKGGTSLNKVHAGFYRLSEDVDFSIPVPSKSTRTQRSKAAVPLKQLVLDLSKRIPVLKLRRELTATNEQRQYNAEIEYSSVFGAGAGIVKFEVGLREMNELAPMMLPASTLLLNPFTGRDMISPIPVNTFSKIEAYSEKMRAALTRNDPAIRDWFDLEYAIASDHVDIYSEEYIGLVRKKLALLGKPSFQSMEAYRTALLPQLETELRPVLRESDFQRFSLDQAISRLSKVVQVLSE